GCGWRRRTMSSASPGGATAAPTGWTSASNGRRAGRPSSARRRDRDRRIIEIGSLTRNPSILRILHKIARVQLRPLRKTLNELDRRVFRQVLVLIAQHRHAVELE